MTEQEAAKVLKSLVLCGSCTTGPCGDCERKQAKDAALSALEEIQQYRVIGTVEEFREAKEKQKAMKPVKTDSEGYRYTDTYRCPSCGGNFSGTGIADYCYHCGQALDWSGGA